MSDALTWEISEIVSWLIQNGLALYAAFVGTLALALNFARYRHAARAGQIQLTVSFEIAQRQEDILREIQETESFSSWERKAFFEFYRVKVRNIGHIDVHIEDVGVITDLKKRKGALKLAGECILYPISKLKNEVISPKSASIYEVYLKREETPFTAQRAFVKDKTGREWLSKKGPERS